VIRGIHHTCISTPDLERAIAFYLGVLPGSEIAWQGEVANVAEFDKVVDLPGAVAKAALLRVSNTYVELFEFVTPRRSRDDAAPAANCIGYTHFCFDVDDVWVEYERCKALGMTFHGEPQSFPALGIRTVYGRDPDGNIVELQEVKGRPDIELPAVER